MASLTSEAIEEIVSGVEEVIECEVWELDECDPFWLTPSGRIFVSRTLHHGGFAHLIPGEGRAMMEANWIMGRMHCPERNSKAVMFRLAGTPTRVQRSRILEIIEFGGSREAYMDTPSRHLADSGEIAAYLESQ